MCKTDEFGDETCFQDSRIIGTIVTLVIASCIISGTLSVLTYVELNDYKSQVGEDSIFSKARIIPQLFDVNSTRIPTSDIRVNEDADFRIGYCKEYPTDGLGEIRALIQMDIAPGGFPPKGLEFRFDIPMIESTIQESSILRRCPHPQPRDRH